MAQDAKVRPRFQALRSMVRYIDEYPEKLHHPKEDEHPFARLIRELERSLLFFEEGWPRGAREFRQAVDRYAEFHWNHMRKEESRLLPLAERHLTAEDWKVIDAAFAANADPLAGVQERDFEQLFSRIADLAPAPVGLGEPWSR